jgi:hypothetical protein
MENLSYNILKDFCQIRNKQNAMGGLENPETNRVNFILDKIEELKLNATFNINKDIFTIYNNKKLLNIELIMNGNKKESVIFIAHHDVNNVYSENCQDNSASVTNLIELANRLHLKNIQNNESFENKNIHFVFTDCEEFGGIGAERLSKRIKEGVFGEVLYVINLELTANGKNLWKDTPNFLKKEDLKKFDKESQLGRKISNITNSFHTPFNDSVILRENNIESICIGSLNDEDLEEVNKKKYCSTWALCHSEKDTFERSANANDMSSFVDYLESIV